MSEMMVMISCGEQRWQLMLRPAGTVGLKQSDSVSQHEKDMYWEIALELLQVMASRRL